MVVKFFVSSRGEAYVKVFVSTLDPSTVIEVAKGIGLLKEFGYHLRMPYSKALGSGLFELRVIGRRQIRVFYGYVSGEVWLLHAFEKKTQKTPLAELRLAHKRLLTLIS
jgi:phage-related protein